MKTLASGIVIWVTKCFMFEDWPITSAVDYILAYNRWYRKLRGGVWYHIWIDIPCMGDYWSRTPVTDPHFLEKVIKAEIGGVDCTRLLGFGQ
jgi:hypothetical protein